MSKIDTPTITNRHAHYNPPVLFYVITSTSTCIKFLSRFYFWSPWTIVHGPKGKFGRFLKVAISPKLERPRPPKSVCMYLTSIPTCINFLSRFRSIEFFHFYGLSKTKKATPTKLDTQVRFTVFMASGSLNVNIVIAFTYVKSQTKLKIKLKFYQNWVRLELSLHTKTLNTITTSLNTKTTPPTTPLTCSCIILVSI